MKEQLSRRDLLKAGASSVATFMIAKSGILAKGASPNNKLNIAMIGCGNRGRGNMPNFVNENVVALCDPNAANLKIFMDKFPQARGAKVFEDWRKCLDMKGIDAVCVQPPDHHHAFVNIWAMNRGYHVYGEKPLGNTPGEARMVREVYLKNKGKIATQMGVQRHEIPNMHRVAELIRDGAIGTPLEARLWCGRTPTGGGFPPSAPVPAYINWDLWVGPSKMVEYSPGYFGTGCLAWNKYWSFGTGQIGDMGSHIMDIAWWALDLGLPTSCECQGSESTEATVPTWLTASWDHPANSWRPELKVYWYDGGKMPGMPTPALNKETMKGDHCIFKGDQGWLVCDFQNRILIPKSKEGDLTYFHTRTKETQIAQSPGHFKEWINACKTDLKTRTDFEYAGNMVEHNMLTLVSYKLGGKKLDYDPKTGKCTNAPEAEQYINKTYRKGWELNG